MNISEFIKFLLSNNDKIVQRNSKRKNPHRTKVRASGSKAQLKKARIKIVKASRRKNR